MSLWDFAPGCMKAEATSLVSFAIINPFNLEHLEKALGYSPGTMSIQHKYLNKVSYLLKFVHDQTGESLNDPRPVTVVVNFCV